MKYKLVPVTHYQQNCSIVWCESSKKAAIIDPGGDASIILAEIKALGLNVVKIILTHGHMDHVGATSEMKSALGVPVVGPHKGDGFWIDALDQQAQMMGFSPVQGFTPDTWLEDGDTIQVGELRFDVAHCPGHTPGHIVLVNKKAAKAFVGDVIFNGSIGRTDFPRGNHDQLIHSIRTKLWPLGDDVSFVPGHGPESTIGYERRHNPFVSDKNFG